MVIPGIIELADTEVWAIIAALVMMAVDIVSGFAGACVRGEVSSTKMREGLGHKAMLVIVIFVAILLQIFTLHIGDMGWSFPLITPACIYIVVMELASVLENVCAAYPELRDTPLIKLFDRTGDKDESD